MKNQSENLDQIIEMLPWYLNGSLRRDEARIVEQELAVNDELQAELKALRLLRDNIEADELRIPDASTSFQRLQARMPELNTKVVKQTKVSFIDKSWLYDRLQRLWSPLPVFASIAAAVLIFWVIPENEPNNVFTALSDAEVVMEKPSENSIIVSFKQPLESNHMAEDLAKTVGAMAIDGPNSVGAYELYFPTELARDQALVELRKGSALQMVEPTQKN